MLSLKTKKNLFRKDATTKRLLDIAREERKTFKKEKEKRKIRKSQITINKFLFLLFYIEKNYFVGKHIWKNLFILLHLYYSFFAWQVVGNAVINTNTHIDMHRSSRRRTSTQNTWQ